MTEKMVEELRSYFKIFWPPPRIDLLNENEIQINGTIITINTCGEGYTVHCFDGVEAYRAFWPRAIEQAMIDYARLQYEVVRKRLEDEAQRGSS